MLTEEFQAMSQGQGRRYFGPWSRLPPLETGVQLEVTLGTAAARSPGARRPPLPGRHIPQEQRLARLPTGRVQLPSFGS